MFSPPTLSARRVIDVNLQLRPRNHLHRAEVIMETTELVHFMTWDGIAEVSFRPTVPAANRAALAVLIAKKFDGYTELGNELHAVSTQWAVNFTLRSGRTPPSRYDS
jgi:hypothetical protein